MVNKCCVPGCQSNYKRKDKVTEYVTQFRFPKEENRRNEWIKKIPRENLNVTNNSRVCIQHFEEKDIVRYDIFPCANGDPDIKVSILI